MSRSSSKSSNPSSRSNDSTETTSTAASDLSNSGSSHNPHHRNNGMDSHELKGERPAFLSFFSSNASKQKGPRYTTAPSLDDIVRRHHVNFDPQSIVDNAPLSIIPGPDDKMLEWEVGLTMYPDPSDPGKIGSDMTHFGVDTTKADKAAGIYAVDTVDASARGASAAFCARISRQHYDLVKTFNTTEDNTQVDMKEVEAAKDYYAPLYEMLEGKHTVPDLRNLLSTFEEESQKYIFELRAKKQRASRLPLEFGGPRGVSIQWVENVAPGDGN